MNYRVFFGIYVKPVPALIHIGTTQIITHDDQTMTDDLKEWIARKLVLNYYLKHDGIENIDDLACLVSLEAVHDGIDYDRFVKEIDVNVAGGATTLDPGFNPNATLYLN